MEDQSARDQVLRQRPRAAGGVSASRGIAAERTGPSLTKTSLRRDCFSNINRADLFDGPADGTPSDVEEVLFDVNEDFPQA